MKKILISIFLFTFQIAKSQKIIEMKQEGGIYTIPCKVNDLKLRFIFDTGASNVSMSLSEILFMLKNDYISDEDIYGVSKAQLANGDIVENTEVLLKKVEIGGIILNDVKANIIHELQAPLLLGQSAIKKLGPYKIEGSKLTILNAFSTNDNIYNISEIVVPKYNWKEKKYSNNSIYLLKSTMEPFTGKVKKVKNNVIVEEFEILNGKNNGVSISRHDNGKLSHKSNYTNGKIEGEVKYWDKNGQLNSLYNWSNDKKNGTSSRWDKNGQLIRLDNWSNNNKNGICKSWFKHGQLESEEQYLNGMLTYSKKWYNKDYIKRDPGNEQLEKHVIINDSIIQFKEWHPNGQIKINTNFNKKLLEKSKRTKGILYGNGTDFRHLITYYSTGKTIVYNKNGNIDEIYYFKDSLIWKEKFEELSGWLTIYNDKFIKSEKTYFGKGQKDGFDYNDFALKKYEYFLVNRKNREQKNQIINRTYYPSGQIKEQITYWPYNVGPDKPTTKIIAQIRKYKENENGLKENLIRDRSVNVYEIIDKLKNSNYSKYNSSKLEILTYSSLHYNNGKIKRKVTFNPETLTEKLNYYNYNGNIVYEAEIKYLNNSESRDEVPLFGENIGYIPPIFIPLRDSRSVRVHSHCKLRFVILWQKTYDSNGDLIANYGPTQENDKCGYSESYVFFKDHFKNFSKWDRFNWEFKGLN